MTLSPKAEQSTGQKLRVRARHIHVWQKEFTWDSTGSQETRRSGWVLGSQVFLVLWDMAATEREELGSHNTHVAP